MADIELTTEPRVEAGVGDGALAALLAGGLLTACGGGGGGGGSGVEAPAPAPTPVPVPVPAPPAAAPTVTEASRFLAQASMGATREGLARVQAIGYGGWLDEQFAMAASGTRRRGP